MSHCDRRPVPRVVTCGLLAAVVLLVAQPAAADGWLRGKSKKNESRNSTDNATRPASSRDGTHLAPYSVRMRIGLFLAKQHSRDGDHKRAVQELHKLLAQDDPSWPADSSGDTLRIGRDLEVAQAMTELGYYDHAIRVLETAIVLAQVNEDAQAAVAEQQLKTTAQLAQRKGVAVPFHDLAGAPKSTVVAKQGPAPEPVAETKSPAMPAPAAANAPEPAAPSPAPAADEVRGVATTASEPAAMHENPPSPPADAPSGVAEAMSQPSDMEAPAAATSESVAVRAAQAVAQNAVAPQASTGESTAAAETAGTSRRSLLKKLAFWRGSSKPNTDANAVTGNATPGHSGTNTVAGYCPQCNRIHAARPTLANPAPHRSPAPHAALAASKPATANPSAPSTTETAKENSEIQPASRNVHDATTARVGTVADSTRSLKPTDQPKNAGTVVGRLKNRIMPGSKD